MIDKAEIECRFKRSVESYDENAHAQKVIVHRLMTLLNSYSTQDAQRILEVGCGTGLLTTLVQQKFKDSELFINDLVDLMCNKTARRCCLSSEYCIVGDIERIILPDQFDLIISASTFQWLSNPANTFSRLSKQLKQGGELVFSTFGTDNYKELRAITGQGLVYRSLNEMVDLLSSCFEVVYQEESRYVLDFNDPMEVLRHVKKTGVNAMHTQQAWNRKTLEEFTQKYTECFLTNGRYPLTYHPQYFICRSKAL